MLVANQAMLGKYDDFDFLAFDGKPSIGGILVSGDFNGIAYQSVKETKQAFLTITSVSDAV